MDELLARQLEEEENRQAEEDEEEGQLCVLVR